jgi:hypothetical protein
MSTDFKWTISLLALGVALALHAMHISGGWP